METFCAVPKAYTVRICCMHNKREKSNVCKYCNSNVSDETINFTTDWDEDTCTEPKDLTAYGILKFNFWPSTSTAKYVKFMHTTLLNDMIRFLEKCWKLKMPRLILSVTGGEKSFNLSTDLRKAFKIGLIKVARSTGAWIITSGINAGVTRLVGEAVSESTIKDSIVLMGITKWNNVEGRELLENNHYRIVQYNNLKDTEYKNRLNSNHSHFIFFEDNLTENLDEEIIYRSNFECLLRAESGAAMMLIVVQGCLTAFRTVENALRNGVTVLCLQNSGGCADILTRICSRSKECSDETLKSLVYNAFTKDYEEILTCLNSILELWKQNKSLVSVFSVEYEEDFELAILKGFISARKENFYETFELALIWNHYEIARTSIITTDMHKNKLESLFELALIYDRYEFAEILLENGVQLEEFLTNDRWKKLFNLEHKIKMTDCVIWRSLAKRKIQCKIVEESTLKKVVQILTFRELEIDFFNRATYAAQNLFLWALLYNRTNVAKLLWKNGKYHTMNAILASKILKSMTGLLREKSEALMKEAEEFEDLAIDILNTIHKETLGVVNNCLLLRKVPIYNVDCIKMALNCECKRFLLQPSIQVLLNEIWNWNITIKRTYRNFIIRSIVITLSIVSLGTLTPFFMEINRNQLEGIEHNKISQQFLEGSKFANANKIIMKAIIEQSKVKVAQSKLPNKKLLFAYTTDFFKRPKTVFIYDIVLHLIFVTLFSYMMLCEFHYYKADGEFVSLAKHDSRQAIGIVVDIWIVAISVEELRQFIVPMKSYNIKDAKRQNFLSYFKFCFKYYINDDWNMIDCVGCLIFYIGEGIRLFVTYSSDDTNYLQYEILYKAARIILSIDLLIWYSRILFFYLGSETWGPKLEIIRHLMKDLLFFALIIGVVSCAFAVVTEATMFPQYSFNTDIIKGMIRNGFWIIFGEFRMYDVILDAEDCKKNGQVCPDDIGLVFSFTLLICYPFVTLMIVNLLIAMFNSTFEKIHNDSQVIWRYQRYYLIFSYCKYPFMLAPFSLFGDTILFIYEAVLWMKRKFFGHIDDKLSQIDQEMENNLVLYEYRCTNEVYQKKETIARQVRLHLKRKKEQDQCIRSIDNQLKQIEEDIQRFIEQQNNTS